MLTLVPSQEQPHKVAEYFRLSLAKLGALNIPVTPTNYALAYYYVSGDNVALNTKLDVLFASADSWSDEEATKILVEFIRPLVPQIDDQLHQNLLTTVAHILGLLTDISDMSALSSDSLTTHLEALAESKEPQAILGIASEIVAGTRDFVNRTKQFEVSLQERNDQIQSLHDELYIAKKQATLDALTGLNNRRGFDDALIALMSHGLGSSHNALLLLDIDHFKSVNDTFGHLVGDKILVGVAKQLAKQMRGSDYLARFGGEEFAIILKDTPLKGAVTAAENLRKSIEKIRWRQTKSGKEIGQVTISIGVAAIQANEPIKELLGRCDVALYQAKAHGRNRTRIAH